MSKLDTNHVVNLDLVKDRVNSIIKFGLADVETSDFYLGLYNNGSRVFDKDYIVTLYIVKPNGTFRNIELEPKEGLKKYYCNLPDTLKNIPGEYLCQAIIFDNLTGEKKISKSKFKYSVDLDLASEMAGIIDEEEQESILTNILNRLLTLENPVEPYATQKHVDECVSMLTGEIDTVKVKNTEQDNRLSNIESKNTEQDRRLTIIEEKDVEQDGRLNLLENQVNGIDEKIVDTIEPSLDNYGNRLDTLETKDITHESKLTNIESKNAEQDNRLNSLENKDLVHESRLTNIESKNTEQDNRLDIAENRLANIGNDITNTMQPIIDEHTSRLDAIEAIDVAQNNRLDAIEVKNQQQDDRLLNIEKVNKRQDIDINCLFNLHSIDIEEEGNSVYLRNSTDGRVTIDNIQGNTMVNCNKEPDKELILNGNINTQGYNNVTLTEGVDSGLVDVALEGNTMVNVCDQKDPVAITKSYTVETGNHVALQGEYDGKCRPVVTGNTLVNLVAGDTYVNNRTWKWQTKLNCIKESTTYTVLFELYNIVNNNDNISGIDISIENLAKSGLVRIPFTEGFKAITVTTRNSSSNIPLDINSTVNFCSWIPKDYKTTTYSIKNLVVLEGNYTNKPTPEYFEGLQSSFEDKLVTQEMVDSGEEEAENLGKYKVDYAISREDGTVGFTKTFYLNNPLLKGDTIEQQGDNVVHVHRSELRAYETDDKLTLPTDMTNTLVAKATPQYEVISQNDTILCDSYVNGHLDVDSVVPIEKVDFLHFEKDLTYLYANTQYTVQFVSNEATTVDIALGGTQLLAQNIVVGLNRISITTPSELIDNKLIISGAGANISEVVVTEATDQDFGYFEGMKSVGECEELAITSSNSDNSLSNSQQLTHEPLRGIGEVRDRYVMIDGKWYIERKCGYRNNYSICDAWSNENLTNRRLKLFKLDNSIEEFNDINILRKVKSNKFKCVQYGYTDGRFNVPFLAYITENGNLWVSADINYTQQDMLNYIDDCQFVYELQTPTYEPIDYNPFEVYNEVTHISNNSTIPCNMTIKNTGYNCLLKPSTTYTVSSNLGLNVVTTPAKLTEDCLRFYDTDTSSVTTMKNVTVLEGDYTTGKPLPSHFSGIESAFEQEYDEAVGKYKVKIRVQNEDASKENYIEFYIDEPLRGIRDVKDKVYVKNDKVVVQRNCGIRAYEDGDFGAYLTDKVNTVYPLAEPIYEEVEYDDVKLFIESFKNSTLFYNSNIPVTSKLWYSYSVPIVDTVAQTANISDQQDSMIIDLATQCAVMEIMLM